MLAVSLIHTICARHSTARQTTPARDIPRPIVGAIRWDGWIGNRGVVGQAVQETLGPAKWHYRLPFFAKVVGDATVEIDGTSQAVVDREIEYAAAAGLDYWAFVTYSADDPLSLALKRYLSSPLRSKIRFCLITECERWHQPAFIERVAQLIREPGYQTVLGGRPLLYLGFIETEKVNKAWGSVEGFRKALDGFRANLEAKGLLRPYIAIMDFHAPQGKTWADALGCDAIGSYAAGWQHGRVPYARWAANTESFWEKCRQTGAPVVPIVMTGWDPRPRVEKPVPWGNPYQQHNGEVDHCLPAHPVEIANHLGNALDWLAANRDAAPAQTAIIYAWNEFDEGGWLAPTVSEGSARLDAIAKVLRPGAAATRPSDSRAFSTPASNPARSTVPTAEH